MGCESDNNLLIRENFKTDKRVLRLHTNRDINAVFCGVVLGFMFSTLIAYNGVFESDAVDISPKNISNEHEGVEDDGSGNIAEYLYNETRILCVMLTSEKALKDRGRIIVNTWGKRCNRLLFFSEEDFPKSNGNERVQEAMKYVYKHHLNEFDWILKVEDKTYVILENLRYLLYQYDPDWPLFIGQRFLKEDYMIGAYVLSKRAFVRLLEQAYTNPDICNLSGTDADKETARCLQHVNVLQIDGLDSDGRAMFFQNNPESAVFPSKFDDYDKWYWHKLKQGIENCCSDRLIIVQNNGDTHLYYMEYFIYKVHAFGRRRLREPLPKKFTLDEVVKNQFK